MVQIFKTNVTNKIEAELQSVILSKENPGYKIKFDLDDCDNILRIKNIVIAFNLWSLRRDRMERFFAATA